MQLKDRLTCIQFILSSNTFYLNNGYPSNEDQKLLTYEYKLGNNVFNWKEDVIIKWSDLELLNIVTKLSNNMKSKEFEQTKNHIR